MRKTLVSIVLAALLLMVPTMASFATPSNNGGSARGAVVFTPLATSAQNSTISDPATNGAVQKNADGSVVFIKADGKLLIGSWAVVTESYGKVWKYFGADGRMFRNTWAWITGKDGVTRCYYFDANGVCLLNGTTPDGYIVGGSGAWIKNGVVQTK